MRKSVQSFLIVILMLNAGILLAQTNETKHSFRIKYVTPTFVYLDGGRSAGLEEGMELTVKRLAPGQPLMAAEVIGTIVVTSVANNSALCDISPGEKEVQRGDFAILPAKEPDPSQLANSTSTARTYPQVISFSQGDPLEEELREYVPRPPLAEENRLRGRIGIEHSMIQEHGEIGSRTSQDSLVVRVDMTRMGGSYWNLTGYWRGRIDSRQSEPTGPTLNDLLNRTYHLGMYYNNPRSQYVAGFGRLLLPWASSLNTLDGGYFGRKLGKSALLGVFAGSTPDPTAWNYRPDRQMGGIFTNFEGGNYDHFHYTTSVGVALTRLSWKPEREFLFLENGLFLKRYVSAFYNLEADLLSKGRLGATASGPVLSRSFLTLRFQPRRFISFDLNHNYFRQIPTFDSQLISTGLLDRLLFQGLSGGVRLDLPFRVSLYTSIGRDKRKSEISPSWNKMGGITLNRIWKTGVRADFRLSQFDSSYGKGSYEAISISRDFNDRLHLEIVEGRQNVHSLLTRQNAVHWINCSADWFINTHLMLGGGLMEYRGNVQNYDQIFVNLGYRF
jgi:hypothetical protein